MNPLDYSLCTQTVTVYRKQADRILRQVVENCYFRLEHQHKVEALGSRREKAFLLIVPGEDPCVFAGDRVLEGIGPEIEMEQWNRFIPALVDGLVEVSYTAPYCWEGSICHVEAGGR